MILIDPPAWPAHGRLWSHLSSDTSLEELHAFAARAGIPARSFETDHYDVPMERYQALIDAGARPVAGRDLLAAMVRAGLRRPRRKGEQVIASWMVDEYAPGSGRCRVDVLTSPLPVPVDAARPGWSVSVEGGRVHLVDDGDGLRLPIAADGEQDARPVGQVRVRLLQPAARHYDGPQPWIFRPAVHGPRRRRGEWVPPDQLSPHHADTDVWPLVRALAAG